MRKTLKIVFAVVLAIIAVPIVLVLGAAGVVNWHDEVSGTLMSGGVEREYLLHVPASYDPAQPVPLVISLHAGLTWPAHQMNLTHWNLLADQEGFIVVYPAGRPQMLGMMRMWYTFHAGAALKQDLAFIAELIDRLAADYNIDPARIYADGLSNGGGMAFTLSCAMSERIAAVGIIAPAQTLPPEWCAPARPVPVIAFHGDADPLVPYSGGPLGDPFNPVKPVFAPIREVLANWAVRNRCAPDAVESTVAADVTRLDWSGCADDAAVTLYTIAGGGHTWPGGKPMPEWRVGPTTDSIDATRLMWEFYLRRSRTTAGI